MNRRNNICKFVTPKNYEKIVTTNFVLECNAPEKAEMRSSKNNAVYLVVSGKGKLSTALYEKDLSEGDMFFTFIDVPFSIENCDNFQYMYITFHGERSQELFLRFGISPSCCVLGGYSRLLSFWQTSLNKSNEKNLDLISESVLLYTFSQISPAEDTKQSTTHDVLEYIEENFQDSKLTLSTAADALGYNPKYLSRIFKEDVGITFSEHLKNVRLQHSIFLMEQGVTSIKNVAFLSGYNDPFYFSNVFKASLGISPSQYIKKENSL